MHHTLIEVAAWKICGHCMLCAICLDERGNRPLE